MLERMSSLLPIESVRELLRREVRPGGRFILQAPTGSGKSTQVPQMLIDEGCVPNGQVIILQPRRIAARMLARRIAWERGSDPGHEVGYQVRFENVSSRNTRILMLTEGILMRRMMDDPRLRGVAAVVFDEFHERHISSDVSLAQCCMLQQSARPDLILGVMSATLPGEALSRYLRPTVVMESEGRMYPVEIEYAGSGGGDARPRPVWERAADELSRLIKQGMQGSALVFMPGAYEISRTISEVRGRPSCSGYDVLPLHGELPPAQQDAAVDASGRPRIIVATNVAETSLTIPGIRVVVDSGLARIPVHDPLRGINTLLVQGISQASAAQRAGRAGREAPGHCVRLWSLREHESKAPFEVPEIRRLDLAETVLTLKASGYGDLRAFPWFEAPSDIHLSRAESLLGDLGAMDCSGALTGMGRTLAAFPLHPRYSRLFVEASGAGCLQAATVAAALSQERSLILPLEDKRCREERENLLGLDRELKSDLLADLKAWQWVASRDFDPGFCRQWGIQGQVARQADRSARQFLAIARQQGLSVESAGEGDADRLRKCLLTAFPDHLAMRLDKGTLRCGLVHGRKGMRRRESLVEDLLFVSAEIEERNVGGEVQVMLGMNTAVEQEWLRELFPDGFGEKDDVEYDLWQKRVRRIRRTVFRDLVIREEESLDVPTDKAASLLASEVNKGGIRLKHWGEKEESFIRRVALVAQYFPEYEIEPIGDEERGLIIEQLCMGAFSEKDVREREVMPALREWLLPEQLAMVDEMAPDRVMLSNGRQARVRYEVDGRVIVSATIQHFYDAKPLKLGNRIPVIYELLAPSHRPAQVTEDIAGFWESSYPMVRKELKARYPKHEWR